MDNNGRLPLGLCKQAYMKLESAYVDIMEIKEDDDLDDVERGAFSTIADNISSSMAYIINIIAREIGEEEFLSETIPMDEIEAYPEKNVDLLSEEL